MITILYLHLEGIGQNRLPTKHHQKQQAKSTTHVENIKQKIAQ